MSGYLAKTSLQPLTRSITAETCGPFSMITLPLWSILSARYWHEIWPAWTLLVCTVASAPGRGDVDRDHDDAGGLRPASRPRRWRGDRPR